MVIRFLQRNRSILRIFIDHPTFTVFVVNFCIMTLELTAGRMVAPYVGVSLYTWTGVIGVVLLGITIGNYYGGKIADQHPKKEVIGYLLVGAGIFSLITIFMLRIIGMSVTMPGIPYILQVFLITSIFLFPSMMLGAVSPVIVKLSIRSLRKTGGVVGNIYASAALGSIVGTYATGFYLISTFGVRFIVVVISLILFLVSAAYLDLRQFLRKSFGKKGPFLLLLLALATVLSFLDRSESCYKESNYYCIKIVQKEDSPLKRMALDKLVHSISHMENPGHIEYDYEKLVAVFYEAFHEEPKVLLLGGGGYTLPRYLVHRYRDPVVTVVEIDPLVSEVAFTEFDMPRDSSVETVNIDARMFLRNLDRSTKYSLIFGDAFSDFSIPYHLSTEEFNLMVARHLEDGGFYIANVIETLEPGLFLKSFIRTLSRVFADVYLFKPGGSEVGPESRYTYVVVAGEKALDWERLKAVADGLSYSEEIVFMYSEDELKALLSSQEKPIILTDDYVPADNLIAPVYARSVPSLMTVMPALWEEIRSRVR